MEQMDKHFRSPRTSKKSKKVKKTVKFNQKGQNKEVSTLTFIL